MLPGTDRDSLFPGLAGRVYLNTAAEGIPPVSSRDALLRYHETKQRGMEGRDELFAESERCRASTAQLFGLKPAEIAFCSSTSEAYHLLSTAIDFGSEGEAVIADLEYPSGASPWFFRPGPERVRVWRNEGGILDPAKLTPLLSEKTKLVQFSLVSFLTGYRLPLDPVRSLVRELAPNAIFSLDVTQAAGRIDVRDLGADCLFASGYKWLLGSHGSGVVAVPDQGDKTLRVQAGGWYNLEDAFGKDRFSSATNLPGAAGFAAGMPSFPALYTLREGIDLLLETGIEAIAAHADGLVARLHEGLAGLGLPTMSPAQPDSPSGIVAMQTDDDAALNRFLLSRGIHVMHQAGRLRFAVHGYNRDSDIDALLDALHDFSGR